MQTRDKCTHKFWIEMKQATFKVNRAKAASVRFKIMSWPRQLSKGYLTILLVKLSLYESFISIMSLAIYEETIALSYLLGNCYNGPPYLHLPFTRDERYLRYLGLTRHICQFAERFGPSARELWELPAKVAVGYLFTSQPT